MSNSKKLISDRWDIMQRYVEGKKVLDIGCVDHKAENETGGEWLHKKIKEKAASVLGLDYLADDVIRLKRIGYDVVEGNAENFDLEKKFDAIVAGNLIEHLSNPGLFLDCVRKHLNSNGVFLLTTDHCYGLRSLKAVFLKDRVRPNHEHVITFEEEILRQLLTRHGFQVAEFYYYNGPYSNPVKKYLMDGLCQIRKSWAWQVLAVCRPKN